MPARLSDRERLLRSISEDTLLSDIMHEAHRTGWLVYHIRNSKRGVTQGDLGFPDLVLARSPRVIFAELKRQGQHLSPVQLMWVAGLEDAPVETYVWQPGDWDEIIRILA
jgi:hypothetical protein